MTRQHDWEYAGFRYTLYETDADVFTASPKPGQHRGAGQEKHIRAAIETFRDDRRAKAERYLIRKGAYYYRPGSCGYTSKISEAGRYTLEEAISLTHPNGPDGPRDGLDYIPVPPERDRTSLAIGAWLDSLAEEERTAARGPNACTDPGRVADAVLRGAAAKARTTQDWRKFL